MAHQAEREEVECVTLRVIARVAREISSSPVSGPASGKEHPGGSRSRMAFFGPRHGGIDTPVIPRSGLSRTPRSGPIIIEEYDATCVVPPGWSAEIDPHGNIVLTAMVPS